MSELATTETEGEPTSAWEFRERYLAYGTIYTEFFCPFCDIQLTPVLVYTDGELSKSPHFAARPLKHRGQCTGEPVDVDPPVRKPPKAHYIPRDMRIPEELIDRPPQRVARLPRPRSDDAPPPSEVQIEARRRAASLGRATPKTYLLQSIIEARNAVLHSVYDMAREKGWTDDKRRAEINDALSQCPLKLADATNYNDGFRTPRFIHLSNQRIYWGDGQVMLARDGTFTLTSEKPAKRATDDVPFHATIRPGDPGSLPRYQTVLLEQLRNASATGRRIRWYAYGMPTNHDEHVSLEVVNLDHLHIKP